MTKTKKKTKTTHLPTPSPGHILRDKTLTAEARLELQRKRNAERMTRHRGRERKVKKLIAEGKPKAAVKTHFGIHQTSRAHGVKEEFHSRSQLHMTTQLRWLLGQKDPDVPTETIGRQIIKTAVDAAKRGNFMFFKEIIDRIDGKVPERLMIDMTERMVKDQAAKLCETILEETERVCREFVPEDKLTEVVVRIGEALYKRLYQKNPVTSLVPVSGGLVLDAVTPQQPAAEPVAGDVTPGEGEAHGGTT
jgi:hypothetical protein